MPTRRELKLEALERQTKVVNLRTQGFTFKQIGESEGVGSVRAFQIYQEGLRRWGEPEIALERLRALEARDINLRELAAKKRNPPPSRVIQHKDGRIETIYDNNFWLQLVDEILKWEVHSARLLGLYSTELKVSDTQPPRAYDDIVTALQTLMESAPAAIEPPVETQATNVTDETARIEDIEQALLNGDSRTE